MPLKGFKTGKKPHNWKGERFIATSGYYTIFVGKDHHLATTNGYAYEHRIVAEQKIGRRLEKGEHVHHIDHDKLNNHPDNLEVAKSVAHHLYLHRTKERGLRDPDEKNRKIKCACGCGKTFMKYDESNRPRKYISGHNPIPAPLQEKVLECLSINPMRIIDMEKTFNKKEGSFDNAIQGLLRKGLIFRVGRGTYALK